MKLSTLNLQGLTDWERRKPLIVDYLQHTDPDIILFQEVVYIPELQLYNQVQLINQSLNYPYIHSAVTRLQPSPQYETYREGLAILSKHPITSTDTIVLKQQPGDEHNRIAQFVDVAIMGETLKLANIHFSLTDVVDFATPHLMETLDILNSRGEQRIIGGDFNIDHLETTAELWQESYSSTLKMPYVSFPDEHKRIDYFLVPNGYTLTNIATSRNGLSDHRALTVGVVGSALPVATRATAKADQLS